MSQRFRRALQGLLKNLDIFVQIAVAVSVAIYGVVNTNTKSEQVVLSVTLAVLALLAYSTFRNRQTDERVEQIVARVLQSATTANHVYRTQEGSDAFLKEYIESKENDISEAVLIQYSSFLAIEIIRALLRKGVRRITLYIQDEKVPHDLGSEEQEKRIGRAIDALDFLPGELGDAFDSRRLAVYKYRVPATVRAVRIDDKLLCIGWYTYEHVDDKNRSPAFTSDRTKVSGQNMPGFIVWKGTEEFDVLDGLFRKLEDNYKRNAGDPVPPNRRAVPEPISADDTSTPNA